MGNGASTEITKIDENKFKELFPNHFTLSLFNKLSDTKSRIIPLEIVKSFLLQDAKDGFLTHDWGIDESGRENHKRVLKIFDELKKKGFLLWFDEVVSSVELLFVFLFVYYFIR